MSDQNPHDRLKELEASIKDKELMRTLELSKKDTTTAVIISILFPIGGYIYTQRWKALGISFATMVGLITMIIFTTGNNWNEKQEESTTTFFGIVWAIVAPIDNANAIKRAKEEIESLD